MDTPELRQRRVETVLGALLYLMTAYHRTRCPRIAASVARHLDCLADHPQADATIRDLCAEMREEWRAAAGAVLPRHNVH